MISIVVKWFVRPDQAENWLSIVDSFTQATRAEPGNLFFEWSRSVDDPNTYVLLEAFQDAAAGSTHVNSEHFKRATRELRDAIAATPRVIYADLPDVSGWTELAEIKPR